MSYRGAVLRAADNITSLVFYASRQKPTLYCGRWMWVPSTMWESLFSRYELAVARAMRNHLEAGQTFWDIGANVGWFSVFASKIVGASGRVISFEPSPEVFDILFSHAKIAGRITAIRLGVGNADEVRLFAAHGKSSSSSFVEEVVKMNFRFHPAVQIQNIEVELRKVDTLVKELESTPSLLKIDVEGFELEVLRGASELLSSRRPTLIIEVHPRQLELSGGTEELLFQFLRDCGYAWEVIDRNPNSLYTIIAELVVVLK
jgi:FkbM family methyltransferase